jgi:ketosteroid isomerase-like protein
MKWTITLVSIAVIALLVLCAACQQPKPEQPAALTADDVAAVGKTIDTAIETYVAKDIDRHMSFAADDAVSIEYDKRFQGAAEIREKHIKPEMADMTDVTYKAADRVVRGHSGLAYVVERNVIQFKDKDGKMYSTDSAWASYVLEKQPDGAWKCKLAHWSGPMNWLPKQPEKAAAKK